MNGGGPLAGETASWNSFLIPVRREAEGAFSPPPGCPEGLALQGPRPGRPSRRGRGMLGPRGWDRDGKGPVQGYQFALGPQRTLQTQLRGDSVRAARRSWKPALRPLRLPRRLPRRPASTFAVPGKADVSHRPQPRRRGGARGGAHNAREVRSGGAGPEPASPELRMPATNPRPAGARSRSPALPLLLAPSPGFRPSRTAPLPSGSRRAPLHQSRRPAAHVESGVRSVTLGVHRGCPRPPALRAGSDPGSPVLRQRTRPQSPSPHFPTHRPAPLTSWHQTLAAPRPAPHGGPGRSVPGSGPQPLETEPGARPDTHLTIESRTAGVRPPGLRLLRAWPSSSRRCPSRSSRPPPPPLLERQGTRRRSGGPGGWGGRRSWRRTSGRRVPMARGCGSSGDTELRLPRAAKRVPGELSAAGRTWRFLLVRRDP